ncbi:MAG: hypothetical protein ACPG45_04095 [Flavobacteriaceae bacterium]
MTKYLNNILKSVALVGLITVLLTPSVLNLIHSFEHEEHHLIDCHDKSDTHLHEIEFDCSFIQLYATPQIYASPTVWSEKITFTDYVFLKDIYNCIRVTTTYLNSAPHRGPPQLNS